MGTNEQIDIALKKLQEQLITYHFRLESVSDEVRRFLSRQAFISSVGASTRIENAVLTDSEIEWVDTTLSDDDRPTAFDDRKQYILDKLSKDKERSIEEVVGCRDMLDTIYLSATELFPLTQSTLRGLHDQLLRHFSGADYHKGAYKKSTNRVVSVNHTTNETTVVLEPAPPGVVTEMAMQSLVDWYNRQVRSSIWPLTTAIEFVFRFLAIHPFQDGNGRLGRGLFVMALLQSGDPHLQAVVPCVSIDRKIEQNRARYYAVLRETSLGVFQEDPGKYNLAPLNLFFIRMLTDALFDIDFNLKRFKDRQSLSQNARIVWQAFKDFPKTLLSVAQLEKTTGLPRRTIQYSLRSLTRINFLKRQGQGAATRYQLVF